MALITRPPLGPTKTTISLADLTNAFDTIYDEFNGNIDEDNISTSSTVMVGDRSGTVSAAWTISGAMTFSTVPTFPTNGIPDTALSLTFTEARSYSAKQTFNGGIDLGSSGEAENFKVKSVSSLPTPSSAYTGVMLRLTTDNKVYVCDGTNWNDMTYTGAYTGGALRPYSGYVDVDDDNAIVIPFKIDSTSTSAKFWFKGYKFWSAFYRELAKHSHGTSALSVSTTVSDAGHTHDVVIGSHTHTGTFATSGHTHEIDFWAQNNGSHTHTISISDPQHRHTATDGSYYTSYSSTGITASADTVSDHSHRILGTSDTPSATASVGAYDHGTITSDSGSASLSATSTISGDTDDAGVGSGTISTITKTYPDSIQIKINGTDVTTDILTATGWSQIGDGTSSHAFVTTGTGEIDLFSYCNTGINTLEIIEPTAGYGGRVLYHIDIA